MTFGKKRRNETTNPEVICDPTLIDIDFDYTSQLLAKIVIIVSIPQSIKQFEQEGPKSVAIYNSNFKPGSNQFK